MLSPQLRGKVFELWKMFWSSGMTNPLTSIEQITYLLFIKRLESLDAARIESGKRSIYARRPNCQLKHHPKDLLGVDQTLPKGVNPKEFAKCIGHATCRWSYIKKAEDFILLSSQTAVTITPHDLLSQYVFPWLRELEHTLQSTGNGANGASIVSPRLDDAYFQLPPEKTKTLAKAIKTVDELFIQIGQRSANDDILGDVFEYLLSEIETSGKNGQFRTPRHIIRFMIELLDPQPGKRLIDPAAGTGGFLINSIQHLLKQQTDPQQLRLEWDGTPHHLAAPNQKLAKYLTGNYFTAYDNDRTMVRIGWMNMILHGIENPSFFLRDSLSRPPSEARQETTGFESGSGGYDYVLANPPFAGTVDTEDLNLTLFPRNPRNVKEPITNKSELLFLWLILDLLKPGGRAAVIVPEGVLSNSTGAHRELRRQLLFEHKLEGVISLPSGVFKPYAGVKTSILIFEKGKGVKKKDSAPSTESVWFYDVAEDGYTLNDKRNEKPEPNDLWDALHKWHKREVSTAYYQPQIYDSRWRMVDNQVSNSFASLADRVSGVWSIEDLFPDLPRDPEKAKAQIIKQQQGAIDSLYAHYVLAAIRDAVDLDSAQHKINNSTQNHWRMLDKLFVESGNHLLETGYEEFGRKAIKAAINNSQNLTRDLLRTFTQDDQSEANRAKLLQRAKKHPVGDKDKENLQAEVEGIVREFAKLDGYNVKLRSIKVTKQKAPLTESKSWVAPVRVLAHRDDWLSPDGKLHGSHDAHDQVRPQFLDDARIYTENGTIKAEYLDPSCLEANDLNLSAGRYKPFTVSTTEYQPPAGIIRELQALEKQIQTRLSKLLAMVEGTK